eukprot:2224625-Alexandrium_andersonii.AAC.1
MFEAVCAVPNAETSAAQVRCMSARVGPQPEDWKMISGMPSASIFEGSSMWQEMPAASMKCGLPKPGW